VAGASCPSTAAGSPSHDSYFSNVAKCCLKTAVVATVEDTVFCVINPPLVFSVFRGLGPITQEDLTAGYDPLSKLRPSQH
jgi:hypothetical protein